jgi:hypothetical protein
MDSIDFGLYAVYLLLAVAVIIAIALPVVNLFSNPKGLIRVGILVVVIVALFFIGYSMSSPAVTPKYISLGVDEVSVKRIGAGLVMLYIFLFGSLLAMVYSEVSKLFK